METDFHNFTALNMPPNHPARSGFDTLFVKHGAPGSTLLRTHTSPVQIRVMQEWDLPIYAVMPGRVFRRDTPDATHMPVFHQIEGLVVDKGITFAHLAGTIEAFTKAFFGSDFTSRLRPNYFPFTEPSAEFDVRSANGKWIELGGCGMVHPNVLRAGGVDPEVFRPVRQLDARRILGEEDGLHRTVEDSPAHFANARVGIRDEYDPVPIRAA